MEFSPAIKIPTGSIDTPRISPSVSYGQKNRIEPVLDFFYRVLIEPVLDFFFIEHVEFSRRFLGTKNIF